MKSIKFIIGFLALIILSYIGMFFVQVNNTDVVVRFWTLYETPTLPLGFVVLTSVLAGMVFSALLFILEILSLHTKLRNIRRRIGSATDDLSLASSETESDTIENQV